MLQDGLRVFKDGPKDHPRFFFLSAALFSPRMLQDGLRMAKDGPKDHPRFFFLNTA